VAMRNRVNVDIVKELGIGNLTVARIKSELH
jgi:hypothetical protein